MNLIEIFLRQPRRIRKIVTQKETIYRVERLKWFTHNWTTDMVFDISQNAYALAEFETFQEAYAYTLPYGGPYEPLLT